MNKLHKKIYAFSDSGHASWLHEFAWQKIPVKPPKYNRFTPPEAIPQ